MTGLPNDFELIENFKPLPNATKQLVRNKSKDDRFLLYTLDAKEKLNAKEIGKKLSKANSECLAKYDSSTDNQILLKYPIDVNCRDSEGYTPLLLSSKKGKVTMFEILLLSENSL